MNSAGASKLKRIFGTLLQQDLIGHAPRNAPAMRIVAANAPDHREIPIKVPQLLRFISPDQYRKSLLRTNRYSQMLLAIKDPKKRLT